MKNSTWLLAASMSALLGAAACGSSSTGGTTTGSGGHTSTTTTTTTTTTSGTGGGNTSITNGCTEAMATDDTSMTAVTITFGGNDGLKYSPACVKVKSGTMVTFSGDFTTHPLSGGVSGTKDATSPIKETTTGMSASFTMSTAGTFGFFCEVHQSLGMQGAIYVM
jgi:plastocyanin